MRISGGQTEGCHILKKKNVPFQISGNLRLEQQYWPDSAIFGNIMQNELISVQKRKLFHLPLNSREGHRSFQLGLLMRVSK